PPRPSLFPYTTLFRSLPRGAAETTLNPAKGHAPRVIDHIFVEADRFVPVSAEVIGAVPVGGEYPSDHFGVAATVRLRCGFVQPGGPGAVAQRATRGGTMAQITYRISENEGGWTYRLSVTWTEAVH